MCAWICLFLQERRAIEVDGFELPVMSEALHAAVEHTDKLGELFEQVHSSRDKVRVRVRASCSSRCARSHVHVYDKQCAAVQCIGAYVDYSICMHVPEQEFDRTLSRMMLEWCLHAVQPLPTLSAPSPSLFTPPSPCLTSHSHPNLSYP